MAAKERQEEVLEEVRKESILRQEMQKVTGDPEAKYMGPAKTGGKWLKNHKTGTLYRVDEGVVKETRKAEVSKEKSIKSRAKGDGPTRNELMEAVRAKGVKNFRVMNKEELAEVIKPDTGPNRIKEIQEIAVKRWKLGWKAGK